MAENGAFKDDIQKKLGLTDEQNEEFAQLIDEMTKKVLSSTCSLTVETADWNNCSSSFSGNGCLLF